MAAHPGCPAVPRDPGAFAAAINDYKFEVARELGIPLSQGYNGELTSRQAGVIGGHIGGRLGGQMVRRMIAMAEEDLARRGALPR